ncbi:GNAT family N-acetyltransferase [Deinococcus budaensis]|uniref:Ribosomal protein S18 acetylase RimI-like enzyme n=1 Tax=Deinococcus budaensis TaxID=1665626 RepID=A0A7W8LPJ6_9DEIO|nr:GNAT family N-acetyltransferase [Deinococcus budaensis]MBB5233841.1 ribosomal protein S18 acetylase RimI-like enzyme [Deinococcus budaensis]
MFRPATVADAPTLAFHRYPEEVDAAERPPYAAWVAGALERGVYLGWLAEKGGKVVAGAGVTLLEWGPSRGDPQPWRGRVVNVWTDPDFRRRGLARELVTRCLAAARGRGVSRLSLGTTPQARALYGALGFQASGTEMTRVDPG